MIKKIIIVIICTMSISSFFLYTQTDDVKNELETWFQDNPGAEKYRDIGYQILSILTRSQQLSIPTELLMEKLREGASKRVPPSLLVQALSEEAERLSDIVDMINEIDSRNEKIEGRPFFDTERAGEEGIVTPEEDGFRLKNRSDIIKQLSLFQRSGLGLNSMNRILEEARILGKSKHIAFQSLSALIKIPGVSSLSEHEVTGLGEALLQSNLSPSSYATLSSIFLKGRIYQMSYSTISSIVIEILKKGGGLIQIEQEITRRGRKR
jgi:hypothetical protein